VRKIFVQEPDSDIWEKWIHDCQEETQKAIDSVTKGDKPIVNESLYKRKSIKESYFVSKDAPFYGRCVYCETPIADTQYIQIEHFRPKAGIKDENGKVINLKDENKIDTGKPHLGYYWLAYDWRNLLPACQKCNNAKNTIFPVDGHHAQLPNEEVKEKPLLINPLSDLEEDNPENHLAVDTRGVMIAVNESRRGKMCIKLFGLNAKDQLLDSRRKQKERIEFRLLKLANACQEIANPEKSQKEIFEAIVKECNFFIDIYRGKEAYTAAALSQLNRKYSMQWFQNLRKTFEDLLSQLDG
jgi:5-methylcytosine-specific restriction endonuclease McrA